MNDETFDETMRRREEQRRAREVEADERARKVLSESQGKAMSVAEFNKRLRGDT